MKVTSGLPSKKLRAKGDALERAARKANLLGRVNRDMKIWEALNEHDDGTFPRRAPAQ